MTLAPAPQEFRRLHLPGHILLEDPDSGFFFVAVGQQPDGSHEVPPSAAWAWHGHEDRAEAIEGEVSLSWEDLEMAGVVVDVWGLYSVVTSSLQALTASPQAPGSPEDSEGPSLISLPSLPPRGKRGLGRQGLGPRPGTCTSLALLPFLEGGPKWE